MSDGEVSVTEAYDLAEWLNNHEEAARAWPGHELVVPLQEIWADGKVNQRELHRLARLLISVQREWARRPAANIETITQSSNVELTTLQLNEARLPKLTGRFRVPSQSEPGRFYEVNLDGPSCTCPDWRSRRSRLPIGDLTRCCKHVFSIYAKLSSGKANDGWLLAFVQNAFPPSPGARWRLMDCGGEKVLLCTPSDTGWANIFAKQDGYYARFGFNVEERRWAYGSKPPYAREIAHAILSPESASPNPTSGRIETENAFSNHLDGSQVFARLVWVAVAAMAMAILFFTWRFFASNAVSKPTIQTVASATESSTSAIAPVRNTPVPTTSSVTANLSPFASQNTSLPPHAVTTREIHVSDNHRKLIIPKGAQLRVIARSGPNLMVSYEGATVTIPVAATNLR